MPAQTTSTFNELICIVVRFEVRLLKIELLHSFKKLAQLLGLLIGKSLQKLLALHQSRFLECLLLGLRIKLRNYGLQLLPGLGQSE